MQRHGQNDFETRLRQLTEAEARASLLFDGIEQAEFVHPGRTEREVAKDIYDLAYNRFGVSAHWHKHIVRAGPNATTISSDNPPVRIIGDDDLVWIDLGPVFEGWEADIGRSYVVGDDARKRALVRDLPRVFHQMQNRFHDDAAITGRTLYEFACAEAARLGWVFGGKIAGHIVSEFAHAHLPGNKDHNRIGPLNSQPLRNPDALGQERFWILEVHLVSPDRSFGGFYERLLPHRRERVADERPT